MDTTKRRVTVSKSINIATLIIFSFLFVCLISGNLFGLSRAIGGFLRGILGLASYGILIAGITVSALVLSGHRIAIQPRYLVTFSLLYIAIILFVHTLTTRIYLDGNIGYGEYLSLCYTYSLYPSFGGLFAGIFVYPVMTTSFVLACLLFVALICLLSMFSAQRVHDIAVGRVRTVRAPKSRFVPEMQEAEAEAPSIQPQSPVQHTEMSEKEIQRQHFMQTLYGDSNEQETATSIPDIEVAPISKLDSFSQENDIPGDEDILTPPKQQTPPIAYKPRSFDNLYMDTNITDAESLANKIRSGEEVEESKQSLYDSIKDIPTEQENTVKRSKILYVEPDNVVKKDIDTNIITSFANKSSDNNADSRGDIPNLVKKDIFEASANDDYDSNVKEYAQKTANQHESIISDRIDGAESDEFGKPHKTELTPYEKFMAETNAKPKDISKISNFGSVDDNADDGIDGEFSGFNDDFGSDVSPIDIHVPIDDEEDVADNDFDLNDFSSIAPSTVTNDSSYTSPSIQADESKLANFDFGQDEDNNEVTDQEQGEEQPASAKSAFGEKVVTLGGKTVYQQTIMSVTGEERRKRTSDKPLHRYGKYCPPPFELMRDRPTNVKMQITDDTEVATMLEQCLQEFKVDAKVVNIVKGPTVTRFELKMGQGISVKRVQAISDDIAMRMAASTSVRIEVPIPGKDLFGIEVPNKKTALVSLRTIVDSDEFDNSRGGLSFALGINIAGTKVICDLADMPHLLIAGTTGSGKSVCLNCLIVSLMYRYSPEELRFLLVDPKQVEFFVYEKSPHLMIPQIITQPEHCLSAMSWLVEEMERRYTMFASLGVRDITGYNNEIDRRSTQIMQRIVLIIDELNDLMNKEYKAELESRIRALAQKARAAGIHLVFATQRPSVDVLTGTIKANFPARIGLKVSSIHDSKTVLDIGGAEKLLGKGDMLYRSPLASKPERLQAAYVELSEVDSVVQYISEKNDGFFDDEIANKILRVKKNGRGPMSEDDEVLDPLFVEALRYCIQQETASITMLQRVFEIGYNRAGRLIESMTAKHFISAFEGAKSRKVLITKEEFNELYGEDYEPL